MFSGFLLLALRTHVAALAPMGGRAWYQRVGGYQQLRVLPPRVGVTIVASEGSRRLPWRPEQLPKVPGAEQLGSLRPAALEAYSWSISRLSTSQETVRDAYSWSINATSAAIGRAGQQVSQFPQLLPEWLTSRVKTVVDAAQPERYVETLARASKYLYAIGLGVTFFLELVGPVALILCARAIAVRRVARRSAAAYWGSGGVVTPLSTLRWLWLGGEAMFYLACCIFAARVNWSRSSLSAVPFGRTGTREWRRAVWQRILRDPAQSPRDFVEGWMYREAEMATDSPPRMLFKWVVQQVRRSSADRDESLEGVNDAAPTRRAMVEPYGVPYAQLSDADIDTWLCRAVFAKRTVGELNASEAEELCW